jgi:HK97 family phage prohead protease
MPLKRCQDNNQPGWKWGDAGKCYIYTPNDAESELAAKKQALKQAAAMGELPGTHIRSQAGNMELRTTLEKVELRSSPNGGSMLTGYGIRYNKLSKNMGGFVERARPGVAAKTIQEQDIVSLFNHDPNNLLGRKGAFTLRFQDESGMGVRYFVDLPDTQLGRDVAVLAARGDIPGSSFGFKAVGRNGAGFVGRSESGLPIRELREILVRDMGPVTFPAYEGTDVALRSLAEERSMPYEELAEAALENRLADLLFPEQRNEDVVIEDPQAEPTSPAVVRHRIYF